MDVCSLDEIQNLFIIYSVCFGGHFPELGFFCDEKEFRIHHVIRKYKDVTGVSYTPSHFLIEIRKEYLIYLPLLSGAEFRIMVKGKSFS